MEMSRFRQLLWLQYELLLPLITAYPNPNPNRNPNVLVDLRSKETLNSFSYVHAVRPFRNSQ